MNVEELERAMRAAAQSVEPPVNDLVSGGIARGRRMRRRHAVRVAGGTLVVAAVAAGAAIVVPPLLDGPGVVTADTGESADTNNSPTATSGQVAAAQPGNPILDKDLVADTAISLVPDGDISDVLSVEASDFSVGFQFVYDDGAGPGLISGTADVVTEITRWECPIAVNGSECTTTTLPDGTELTVTSGQYYPQPDKEPERLLWDARAVRPDGWSLYLSATNAPTEKNSPISRPEPPLSTDQLTAIVTSDAWPALDDALLAAAAQHEEDINNADDAAADQAMRMAHGSALAEDLGAGWLPSVGHQTLGTAQPDPDLRAGLPEGYEYVTADRRVFSDGEARLDEVCAGWDRDGVVATPCEELTLAGNTVHVQWMLSDTTDPSFGNPEITVYDGVTVRYLQEDGNLVEVELGASELVGASTPERQAAARTWLEEQIPTLAKAATVGGLAAQ